MLSLLIDTSNIYLSLGLVKNDKLIDSIHYECFQKQSEYITKEIENLFSKNNFKITSLNNVIVTIGPGSYTGLRIGITTAKIISYVLQIPIYTISSLEANKMIDRDSIVLFNARNNRSYIAAFSKNKKILAEQVLENDKVLEFINNHPKYLLIGDLGYLNLKGISINTLENMNKLFPNLKPIKDINLVKPLYLKEHY